MMPPRIELKHMRQKAGLTLSEAVVELNLKTPQQLEFIEDGKLPLSDRFLIWARAVYFGLIPMRRQKQRRKS